MALRILVSTLGIIAALVMCAVSAAMNYLFLSSLGKTPLEGQVLGAASAAADVLKALLPFFIAWSWQARRFAAVGTGSLAFVFFAGFSLLSALGFAADNRGVLVEARDTITSAYERMERETRDAETRLTGLPVHRPAAVVLEEIERHRQNRRWIATKECAEATEPQSRDFCAAYFGLRAELAAGQEAERLSGSITALQTEAAQLRGTGAGQDSDPQVSLLSRITGQAPEPVRFALIIAVAVLVEIGASLGLFLASGHGRPAKRDAKPSPLQNDTPPMLVASRPFGSVEDFCLAALVPAKGSALAMSELFSAYQAWCSGNGFAALEATEFAATFEQLARSVGLDCQGGRFRGIALVSDQRIAA